MTISQGYDSVFATAKAELDAEFARIKEKYGEVACDGREAEYIKAADSFRVNLIRARQKIYAEETWR